MNREFPELDSYQFYLWSTGQLELDPLHARELYLEVIENNYEPKPKNKKGNDYEEND